MTQVLIVEALRSPLQDRRGPAPVLPADERAGAVLRALVRRAGVDARELDGVWVGAQVPGTARLAVAAAGLPLTMPACTVPAGHAAGLAALQLAATAVVARRRGPVLAAGASGPVPDPAPGPTAWWRAAWPPAVEAEDRVGRLAGLGEEEVAAFRARAHDDPGDLGEVVDRGGDFADAGPGPDRVAAAGVLLADEEAVRRLRLRVRGRIAAVAAGAGDPALGPLAVVSAVERALEEAGLHVGEVDLVELDASAPVAALAALRTLGLDAARTSVLGYPDAAVPGLAGLPRLCRLVHALPRRRARIGLCAATDGLGQAWAVVVDARTYD
ncbi:hypothetical protein L6R53_10585 [Myxococcota bacterium]|nr:hypothetical protein [Myxococcota bacterium]